MIFFVSMLAETNRSPFDLPEAEAELVAGYNVEYSAISFAMFFLAEYGNVLLLSCICTCFFFGGGIFNLFISLYHISIFFIKMCLNLFIFLIVRATFPRYRYDHLLKIG